MWQNHKEFAVRCVWGSATTLREEVLNSGWIQKEIKLKIDFIRNFKEYETFYLKGEMWLSPE